MRIIEQSNRSRFAKVMEIPQTDNEKAIGLDLS
jgi:hypothetical protein